MNHIELSDSEKELLDKLVNMLNDVEDVQEVYHNAKLD